jgi:hypothetical protein
MKHICGVMSTLIAILVGGFAFASDTDTRAAMHQSSLAEKLVAADHFQRSLAEYDRKIHLFYSKLVAISSTSHNLAKYELEQINEDYKELVQALDALIEYINNDYKLDPYNIDLYKKWCAVQKTLLLEYKRYLSELEMNRSLSISNIAWHWKQLRSEEHFYKWMEKISLVGTIIGGSYLSLASYFNIVRPDVGGAATFSLCSGLGFFILFSLFHHANLDAQVDLRNAIRFYGFGKEKEFEGWEKDIGKEWNLNTDV